MGVDGIAARDSKANAAYSPPIRRRQSLIALIGLPLVAFLVARLFLMAVISNAGLNPISLRTWELGDSKLYLDIAANGYTLSRSDGSSYPTSAWMGNSGWMPLYPWMMRGLAHAGIDIHVSAEGLAILFHLLTLILLRGRFLIDVDRRRGFCCLLWAAFFPGMVYQHAGFPISLLTFLTLLTFDCILRSRWWTAGLAGFLAALSYSTGFLLSPVLGAYVILTTPSKNLRGMPQLRRALCAIFPLAGIGLVFLIHQLTVDKWNAFFLVQAKYGHGIHNPLGTLFWQIHFYFGNPLYEGLSEHVLFVAVLVLISCTWVGITWSRRQNMDRLLAIFACVFWLFPLVMGKGVWPVRAAATLLPMAPLFRRVPAWVQLSLIVISAVLTAQVVKSMLAIPTM